MSYDNSDTPTIRRNFKRTRAVWGRISVDIAKESVPPPVARMFYQAVVTAVLLYGSETWAVSAYDLRALEGFHVEAARHLTDKADKARGDVGLPQVRELLAGSAWADDCGVYCGTAPNYTPDDRGPPHFGGVPGGGEAAREPTPPLLVGARSGRGAAV